MRLVLLLVVTLWLPAMLLADAGLDSLPVPIQNTLKTFLQDPKAGIGGVEIYQWGLGLAYKVIITQDGHPYLEANIGSSGQLVRCDPVQHSDSEDQASPSPGPR